MAAHTRYSTDIFSLIADGPIFSLFSSPIRVNWLSSTNLYLKILSKAIRTVIERRSGDGEEASAENGSGVQEKTFKLFERWSRGGRRRL